MTIPTSSVTRLRVNGPVTRLDFFLFHVGNKSFLPLLVNIGSNVVPASAVSRAAFLWPIHITAEFAHYHCITQIAQVTKVLFPTSSYRGCVDHDITIRVTCFIAFKTGTIWLRWIHKVFLYKHRWTV